MLIKRNILLGTLNHYKYVNVVKQQWGQLIKQLKYYKI